MVRNVKGFTMVELMIVIAIIGVLAVALIPSLLGSQSKSRDVARQSHLNAISSAFDGFYLENSSFPTLALAATQCASASNGALTALSGATVQSDIAKNIKGGIFPTDPQGVTNDLCGVTANKGAYGYRPLVRSSSDSSASYVLFAKIENSKNANISSGSTLGAALYSEVINGSKLSASGAGFFKTY